MALVALVGASPALVAAAPEESATSPAAGEPAFDRDSTLTSLRARIGDELDTWEIELAERGAGEVDATLRRDTTTIERTLELSGPTVEERSRELASALALLLDQAPLGRGPEEDTPSDTNTGDANASDAGDTGDTAPEAPAPPRPRPRGWLALGPRLGVGDRAPDIGVDLLAALETAGGHVHPLVLVGWTTAHRAELAVNYVHFGGGVAAGADLLRERLWVGGGVTPRGMWVHVHEGAESATIWSGGGDIFALGHVRAPLGRGGAQLQASLRAGADVTLPPLLFTGSTAQFSRGEVRLLLAGSLGLRW